MSAAILPFPVTRRRVFIERQAVRAAELDANAAESYINYQIQLQREAMQRRCIDADVIDNEMAAMERAIRNALWSRILAPGGGA
jgi:uncharacterized membrane protein YukC